MTIFSIPGYNIPDNKTPVTDNPNYDAILRYTNEIKRFTYDIHVLWAVVDRLLIYVSDGISLGEEAKEVHSYLSLIEKLRHYGLQHFNDKIIAFDRDKVNELVYEGLDQYWVEHLLTYTAEV